MINVGSVGQPRDGDPRACYAVLEDDMVRFRRVEYPLDVTIQKIYQIPELDNFLAIGCGTAGKPAGRPATTVLEGVCSDRAANGVGVHESVNRG